MAAAQSTPPELTLKQLLSAPDNYLNRPIEVVIVEPLAGPATAKALASIEYGQVRIRVPDGGAVDLSLVPSAFRMSDPARYKQKFERPLASPIKVRGELLLDPEMSNKNRKSYVIRVAAYEALPLAVPKPVKSIAELDADPPKWDRQRIVYEGTYENRFEVSALDGRIWVGFSPTAEIVNAPSQRTGKHKARITGYLYAKSGGVFGHLGAYTYELVADKIEFL